MLNHLEGELNRMGKPGMARIASGMREELGTQGIDDIPFPSVATPIAPEVSLQDTLGRAISEYNKGHLTPELVNTTWQTIWKTWGESDSHTFQVPSGSMISTVGDVRGNRY